jgi:hypothetical protein
MRSKPGERGAQVGESRPVPQLSSMRAKRISARPSSSGRSSVDEPARGQEAAQRVPVEHHAAQEVLGVDARRLRARARGEPSSAARLGDVEDAVAREADEDHLVVVEQHPRTREGLVPALQRRLEQLPRHVEDVEPLREDAALAQRAAGEPVGLA